MTAATTSGATLVLVHGTRYSGSYWSAQRATLGRRHRLVTPDLPGHGSRADEPFTLPAASDAIEGVLESERAATGRAAILVGLSLGGYVSMDVAARRPDLVRGLVLVGASAEPRGILRLPLLALILSMRLVPTPLAERVSTWYLRRRYPAAIIEPVIAGGFWTEGGLQGLEAIQGESFLARMAAYPGPSLILNGAWDPLFRFGAPAFARAAQAARRVRLSRASHLSNLDQPEAFDRAVEAFVDHVEAGPVAAGGPVFEHLGARLPGSPDVV